MTALSNLLGAGTDASNGNPGRAQRMADLEEFVEGRCSVCGNRHQGAECHAGEYEQRCLKKLKAELNAELIRLGLPELHFADDRPKREGTCRDCGEDFVTRSTRGPVVTRCQLCRVQFNQQRKRKNSARAQAAKKRSAA